MQHCAIFRRNQAVHLRNTVSEVRKIWFFDGLSGFLNLGVVLETSNIAHVTPWVNFGRNQSQSSQYCLRSQNKPFLTVYQVFCSLVLCLKLLILPMSLLGSIFVEIKQ